MKNENIKSHTFESISLKYDGKSLFLIDQTKLPHQEVWLDATTPAKTYEYIKSLQVRGAPMIGVAAALSLACYARSGADQTAFVTAAKLLRSSRPTAVNLMHSVDRMLNVAESDYQIVKLQAEAEDIFLQDEMQCAAIAENGLSLIESGDNILTHCNTGALATAGVGTAAGVIRKAWQKALAIHVYVDETRPLLQGARLTSWEFGKLGIPNTLICDNMAGMLMAQGKVQKVIVGSDRIAANGDFANKIGTYSLAVLAAYHKIPFYVAAPMTTVDLACTAGKDIPIEERADEEVLRDWAPKDANVFNPAFDVTPAELVTAWIFDRGVLNLKDIQAGKLKSKFNNLDNRTRK